jgi:hypothetical protein
MSPCLPPRRHVRYHRLSDKRRLGEGYSQSGVHASAIGRTGVALAISLCLLATLLASTMRSAQAATANPGVAVVPGAHCLDGTGEEGQGAAVVDQQLIVSTDQCQPSRSI